ncbi:MAG: hypothetical protein ACTSPM_11070 [Candidatus Heimdallarchaeota archaeon]
MITSTKLGIILVEFDSLKGPVVRNKNPKNFQIPNDTTNENLLVWIIRANEFSVRKIGDQTAHAKAISLDDPNFPRKKRQFGLGLITQPSLDFIEAEKILDLIISESKKRSNNKPYFKMLNGLLTSITNFKLPYKFGTNEIPTPQKRKIAIKDQNEIIPQEEMPLLLISDNLDVFKKVIISSKQTNYSIIIGNKDAFVGFEKKTQNKELSISTEKTKIDVILQRDIPDNLQIGLDIFSRILDVISDLSNKDDRIVSCLEFLDRLLLEDVDIRYYMPFSQYLIAMESYTISEFKTEEIKQQIANLKETHGDWVECLDGKEFDGRKLAEFFLVTSIKRESLELLINLLFVKLIAIF